jgi:predicted O-methyltransferase YrrM
MKQAIKRFSFTMFRTLDSFGLHVLPKHFYTPVPDHAWLASNQPLWMGPSSMRGIHWDLDEQLRWIGDNCRHYYDEVREFRHYDSLVETGWGRGYGPVESQVLHCVLRTVAPPRIIEIGSGASTAVMLNAIALNRRDGKPASSLLCIEPFPRPAFQRIQELGEVRHIKDICQAVPLETYDALESGDVLFIDSSHSLKTGSDVTRIYLEIIPRLKPGVLIHVHDINFPYAYSREALLTYFSFQENAMLLALLTDNSRLSVAACLSALQYGRPDELTRILTDLRIQTGRQGVRLEYLAPGHFPSSIWLVTR